jgi:hypothetical protein
MVKMKNKQKEERIPGRIIGELVIDNLIAHCVCLFK